MWWRVAGIAGAVGVALGAFGAHGLENTVDDPHLVEVWRTGSRYHLIHALALGLVAAHPGRPSLAGWLFLIGIIIFSGTLYGLALTGLSWLGAITPIGGLCFVAGWLALAFPGRSSSKDSSPSHP